MRKTVEENKKSQEQSKNGTQAEKANRNANYERFNYSPRLTTRPKKLWDGWPVIYSR
jgi:hypothetical protein